jgi:carbon starvation protein
MQPLLIALLAGVGFIVAYHTYGRWLGRQIFRLSAQAVCPSVRLDDGKDYVPTAKSVVFGHHFTSIAGTGPIVGPAIAIMWGWLPALVWVVLGSVFIGAVHDLGSLVVSLRNNGQTVGDIAGRVLNRRVRLLFLLILFMGLTIVLAIFGLVIAAVFRQYPAAIFPCLVQVPIAVAIGAWIYRRGRNLLVPSILALGVMYLTVVIGDENFRTTNAVLAAIMHGLHAFNAWMAGLTTFQWVVLLLMYSYVASVLPVWVLLQPRDYINALQLISAMGLIVAGLFVAALMGGAPPLEGGTRPPLEFVAPMVNWNPVGAPMMVPFLFIFIACGAISGFHCLVSSGTSSKQLKSEPDARFIGYGGMLTEGFLATLVILACAAGLGLGLPLHMNAGAVNFRTSSEPNPLGNGWESVRPGPDGNLVLSRPIPSWSGRESLTPAEFTERYRASGVLLSPDKSAIALVGPAAYATQYPGWKEAGGLKNTVGAFVVGSANFVNALGIPMGVCIALMGVLVASFAGTTLDTACRLQRYVIQELAATFLSNRDVRYAAADASEVTSQAPGLETRGVAMSANPITWLRNTHGATVLAVVTAAGLATVPATGVWTRETIGTGGQILWPLFGATNQLLGGLAFMVITFYLRRRGRPIWFLILPMIFMLIIPAWAMAHQVLYDWWPGRRYLLVSIGVFTLMLEGWMIIEGVLMFPKVRNVLESDVGEVIPPRRGFEVIGAGTTT